MIDKKIHIQIVKELVSQMIDRKRQMYIYIYSKGVGKTNDRQKDTYMYRQ